MDIMKKCLIFKPTTFYHKLPFMVTKMSPRENVEILAN